MGKALTPGEDLGEHSSEEVPEAVGGTAEQRLRPPLSTGKVDVSFVVSVSRAGMALGRRSGGGGAEGGKNLFQL